MPFFQPFFFFFYYFYRNTFHLFGDTIFAPLSLQYSLKFWNSPFRGIADVSAIYCPSSLPYRNICFRTDIRNYNDVYPNFHDTYHQSQCNDNYRISRNQPKTRNGCRKWSRVPNPWNCKTLGTTIKAQYTALDRVYSAKNPTSLSGIS
jgi:hypothetical protein